MQMEHKDPHISGTFGKHLGDINLLCWSNTSWHLWSLFFSLFTCQEILKQFFFFMHNTLSCLKVFTLAGAFLHYSVVSFLLPASLRVSDSMYVLELCCIPCPPPLGSVTRCGGATSSDDPLEFGLGDLKLQHNKSTVAFRSPLCRTKNNVGFTNACTKATCKVTSWEVEGSSVL